MELHLDVQAMAKTAFASHELKREKGFTWRMQAPKTWAYGFRVTWARGAVIVTGDLGEIVYSGMTFLAVSPWDAALHLRQCHYDYLTSKTGTAKEYDREATVRELLARAEDERRWGSRTLWEAFCARYSDKYLSGYRELNPARANHWAIAAKALRNDLDLTAEQVYYLTHDGEQAAYSWPPKTRWTYEALMLWANAMAASEPAWHRAWRAWRDTVRWWKSFKTFPLRYRPQIIELTIHLNGARFWQVPEDGKPYRAAYAFKILGRDLSRFGFWRVGGSTMSADSMATYLERHVRPAHG
jgi:hypothetical protein